MNTKNTKSESTAPEGSVKRRLSLSRDIVRDLRVRTTVRTGQAGGCMGLITDSEETSIGVHHPVMK